MEIRSLSVSEVNRYIARLLYSDPILYNVKVQGELSSIRYHQNGHVFFTLKDDTSSIKGMMFFEDVSRLITPLKEGLQVVIKGSITVYEKNGTYQLKAVTMKADGLGLLYEEFMKLKKDLEKKGYFKDEAKKKLPFLPKNIGVVTSKSGAAIHDIVSIVQRRNPGTKITLFPALVQGPHASKSIKDGIEYFNSVRNKENLDVLIVGRGGGALEELWAFNELEVVEAIHQSQIPIVSAVGHESDYTLSDYVADYRASTPSMAAEILVPDVVELAEKLKLKKQSMEYSLNNKFQKEKIRLDFLRSRLIFFSPEKIIHREKEKLLYAKRRFIKTIKEDMKARKVTQQNFQVKIDSLNPYTALNRGYAFVESKNGEIQTKMDRLRIDEELFITFRDGKVKVKITEIVGKED
ncbi:exodeoxyribonuclease VII large subunit [Isachenkonia alkalipeptolytica]|uniref:Exodeoxyribonuclease 7 large subunit n=1 Tax=Isachenkonia alkalipeptolytica TaxID=2565777 RepID=A0AA44BDY0_9CLOT|nr:exodeoxyribonuclease VII large subunit [Isachenkonia alkalipeptolytica]NBG88784.1 exodeoxyribonuclease VII large subunit [Isachenkonia alkalipeptolytica]